MQVIDNFFPEEQFKELQEYVLGPRFPVYYVPTISAPDWMKVEDPLSKEVDAFVAALYDNGKKIISDEYINFMPDYTLSVFDMTTKNPATDITYFEELENSLHIMSTSLINLLRSSQRNIIRSIVSDTRYKKTLCCDFYSGEYIDLHLFLLSLQAGLRQVLNLYDFRNQYPTIATHIQECMNACTRSIDLLYKVIPVYTCGVAFAGNPIRARGISIAFPSRVIHSSYAKTIFAKNNNWFVFLKEFLTTRDKENATAA